MFEISKIEILEEVIPEVVKNRQAKLQQICDVVETKKAIGEKLRNKMDVTIEIGKKNEPDSCYIPINSLIKNVFISKLNDLVQKSHEIQFVRGSENECEIHYYKLKHLVQLLHNASSLKKEHINIKFMKDIDFFEHYLAMIDNQLNNCYFNMLVHFNEDDNLCTVVITINTTNETSKDNKPNIIIIEF